MAFLSDEKVQMKQTRCSVLKKIFLFLSSRRKRNWLVVLLNWHVLDYNWIQLIKSNEFKPIDETVKWILKLKNKKINKNIKPFQRRNWIKSWLKTMEWNLCLSWNVTIHQFGWWSLWWSLNPWALWPDDIPKAHTVWLCVYPFQWTSSFILNDKIIKFIKSKCAQKTTNYSRWLRMTRKNVFVFLQFLEMDKRCS